METRRVLPTNIIKLDNETTWICLTLSLGMMMAHYKAFFFMHHMMDLRLAYMQTNLWKNKSANCAIGGWNWKNTVCAIMLFLHHNRWISLPFQTSLLPALHTTRALVTRS